MSNEESSSPDSSWDRLAEVFFGRLAPIAAATCGMTIAAALFTYYQTEGAEHNTKFLAWAAVLGFFILVVILLVFVEYRNNHFRQLSQRRRRTIESLEAAKGSLDQQLAEMRSDLWQQMDKRVETLRSVQVKLNEISEHLKPLYSNQEINVSGLAPIQEEISSVLHEVSREIEGIEKSRGKIGLANRLLALAENPEYVTREPKTKIDK